MDHPLGFSDAYSPREIAHKVEDLGVSKAHSDTLSLLVLAMLAGAILNLASVTAGNIVGGTLLVAGVYWVAYLRGEHTRS